MDLSTILGSGFAKKLEKIKCDYFASLPSKTFAILTACDKCGRPFAVRLDRPAASEFVVNASIVCPLCK
jgi:hypothetical protein